MKKDDCIFCKLANGDIPTNKVYEDEDFTAILDLGPATKGHTLILPKEHADCLFDLPDETAAKLLPLAKKLGKKISDSLHADGMNVIQNNGEVAGQSVLHYHLHLIPRYKNDGQHLLWKPGKMSDEEAKEILDALT
ncbi:MAG: HIT family protein [Lachnospiraceae bacterium]|nr:HIT family protein [Lachnospiraceae bacterium]